MARIASTHNQKGLALLNLVYLMIFIGVLMVVGVRAYSSLVSVDKLKRTKGSLDGQARSVAAWATGTRHLPATAGEISAALGSAPTDAWGYPIGYVYDANLAAAPATGGDNICGRTTTPVYYSSPTNYVAFALLSGGGSASIPTTWPASGALTVPQGVVARIVTLNELQARAGCPGVSLGYLRILNNELPKVCSGATSYTTNLYGDGGVPGYTWALVSPPAWLQIDASTGVLSSTATPVAGQITVQLTDTKGVSVQRSYTLGAASCGSTPAGGLGNPNVPPVDTGVTSPLDASGNDPTAALFAQSTVTNDGSAQVSNNQISFGLNVSNGSSCVWFPYNFPLYGKTMRAFWKMTDTATDTDSVSSQRGDGFTFTLMDGSSPVSYCGTGSPYNASTNPYYDCSVWGGAGEYLSYCGLRGSSVALEFDDYPSSSRNDPGNDYNHLAFVRGITNHVGTPTALYGDNTHNYGGNPACPTTVNPPSPACNGTCSGTGTCTGTCNGAAIAAGTCGSGTCVGRCTGTCTWTGLASNGFCSGTSTCTGTCNGTAMTNGTCTGTCYGACTGASFDSGGSGGGPACFYNSLGGNSFAIPYGHPNAATWLEDNQTHDFRVEVHTRCNNDCSSCDQTTTTCAPQPAAPGKAFFKAWIDTGNSDLSKDEASKPDVSYCLDLPSSMNQVKFGFTQATGSSVQAWTVKNLISNFLGTCPVPKISEAPPMDSYYRVGDAFPTTTFSGVGGTPPYSGWLFQGSTLPGTSVAGSATFATTPQITGGTLTTAGSYEFAVSMGDACSADGGSGCNTIAQQRMYVVNVCTALALPNTTLSGGIRFFYQSWSVAGTGVSALKYTVSSGSLPPGLSLNASSGAITGIPSSAGTYPFTITLTDACGDGASVQKAYSIKIS